MRSSMMPLDGFFTSFALCIVLLLAGSDASAYSNRETGSSDTASQLIFAEAFALPLNRNGASGCFEYPAKPKPWEVDFIVRQRKPWDFPSGAGGNLPVTLVQRGSLRSETYSLLAELGDIDLSGFPVPFGYLSHKGAHLSFRTGTSGNSLRLAAFTTTNDRFAETFSTSRGTARESVLTGTSGELGFFGEKARIRTFFITGMETSQLPGTGRIIQDRKGNGSRISTILDPFEGRIVADAEIIFSARDSDLAYTPGTVHQTTYKLRIGGKAGVGGIPFDWEYRKLISTASGNPTGIYPISSVADTVSGNLRYAAGPLDFGLNATYSRQYRRITQSEETSATSFAFSPRFLFEDLTISPSFSINQGYSYLTNLRTEIYAFHLDAKGSIPARKLDYELKGSIRQLQSDYSATKHTVATNFRITAPFLGFLTVLGSPSLSIKGEYSRVNRRMTTPGQDDFTLFFTLNGV